MVHCRHTITRWYAFFFLWHNCYRQPTVTGKFWLISVYLFTWLPILLTDSHIWVIRALNSHTVTWVHFMQIHYWLHQEELHWVQIFVCVAELAVQSQRRHWSAPSPPVDRIWTVVIMWRISGKVIKTASVCQCSAPKEYLIGVRN